MIFVSLWWRLICKINHHGDTENTRLHREFTQNPIRYLLRKSDRNKKLFVCYAEKEQTEGMLLFRKVVGPSNQSEQGRVAIDLRK